MIRGKMMQPMRFFAAEKGGAGGGKRKQLPAKQRKWPKAQRLGLLQRRLEKLQELQRLHKSIFEATERREPGTVIQPLVTQRAELESELNVPAVKVDAEIADVSSRIKSIAKLIPKSDRPKS